MLYLKNLTIGKSKRRGYIKNKKKYKQIMTSSSSDEEDWLEAALSKDEEKNRSKTINQFIY